MLNVGFFETRKKQAMFPRDIGNTLVILRALNLIQPLLLSVTSIKPDNRHLSKLKLIPLYQFKKGGSTKS